MCVVGLVVLVVADYLLAEREEGRGGEGGTDVEEGGGWGVVVGDVLVLLGAVCYSISNVGQEKMVKNNRFFFWFYFCRFC